MLGQQPLLYNGHRMYPPVIRGSLPDQQDALQSIRVTWRRQLEYTTGVGVACPRRQISAP